MTTSIPEEIPADIRKTATDVARTWYHEEWEPELYIQQQLVKYIARALLAERKAQIERDAEIADRLGYFPDGATSDPVADAIRAQLK